MKKQKLGLSFLVIIVAFLLLGYGASKFKKFALDSSGGAASGVNNFGNKFRKEFGFIFNIYDLRKENKELSDKITELEVDKSKINELGHENELLKKELGFVQTSKDLELVPSRIIGREPTSFLDYIIVDKGEKDGVKAKAAVISNGALVGQVSEVYNNYAKVTLVTSKDSNILAMLQESRAQGILKGGISGLVLEDINQDTDIKPNEDVVTSGLDGEISQGILIGKTGKLKSSSSDLFKNISIDPVVDLAKLEIVFIVK